MSQRPNHHQQQSQPGNQHHHQPRHPQEQRREFLWRERVKLEMQVQAVMAQASTLAQEWQLLHSKKAALAQQKPQLATHILLAGLVGKQHLPSERFFHYQRERIAQEEERLQQAMVRCNAEAAALQAQIDVIDVELTLL